MEVLLLLSVSGVRRCCYQDDSTHLPGQHRSDHQETIKPSSMVHISPIDIYHHHHHHSHSHCTHTGGGREGGGEEAEREAAMDGYSVFQSHVTHS